MAASFPRRRLRCPPPGPLLRSLPVPSRSRRPPRRRPNRRKPDMVDAGTPTSTVKARKAPRLTAKQEIQTIRNLPRVQRGIVIMKIAGVFLLAIGFEGLVTAQYLYSVLLDRKSTRLNS